MYTKPVLTVQMYTKPVLTVQMYTKPVLTVQPVVTVQLYTKPVMTIQMYTKPFIQCVCTLVQCDYCVIISCEGAALEEQMSLCPLSS